MAGGDGRPHAFHAAHLLLQRPRFVAVTYRLDPEVVGQRRPHAPPAEDIAVDDVVGLVANVVRCGRPDHVVRQQSAVGHVREAVPLRLGAREDERLAQVLTDGCLNGEGEPHVHGVPDRMSDHRMRPVHGPAKALLRGRSPQLVFLGVVEVRRRQPRLALPKGGVRHFPGRIRLKRAQIVLQPGHEGDVLHRLAVEAGEDVPQHARVCVDVLLFGLPPGPGGVEHMGGRNTCQGLAQVLHGCQVRAHMAHVTAAKGIAGEPHHVPALLGEPVHQGGSGNSACPHHQGGPGVDGL
ncbi:hypothetical protein SRABI128_03885 [Microbacterium sp. Bi128]|nr:hypothetical protein SRABI128_03885 [Microbacterium sp. Bi128]